VTRPPPRRPGRREQPGPQDPATQRLPRAGRPEAATEKIPTQSEQGDAAATERIPRARDKARPADPADPGPAPDAEKRRRALLRDPLSISLIALIVIALAVGGLAGAELYARHRAEGLLTAVAECVVKDGVNVSFAVTPPFLWQRVTGDYTKISVVTDGNQVQEAKGMKADVTVEDVRPHATSDSKGTIGSLSATLTWTADGIKDTVAANLPGVGNLVTGLTTNVAAGTLVLDAGSITVTAKPVVVDGNLALQVVDLTGPLDRPTVQGALDRLTAKLNDNYPLGIHADSVEVTGNGVVGKFSTHDASIPQGDGDANGCFARL
jgi:hypothetical protein